MRLAAKLSVSSDGLRYVTKWEGVGDGGLVRWLNFGDVNWGTWAMENGENLQLLSAVTGQRPAQGEIIGSIRMADAGSVAVCSIQGTT